MAFAGHQSTFTNSLFPTYQRQSSISVGGGSNGSVAVPFISIPGVSLQEQDMASYVPWSHIAHDDPYELRNCAQNIESRKPADITDCDGEPDLQGLVLNILDEADSQDSFYSEGNPTPHNHIWSPKTLQEELLQPKTQYSSTVPPNYVSHEAFSKIEGQAMGINVEEFCQQSNGLATNQLFNFPKGDRDIYTLSPQKLPPGLPVHNVGNTYLSQIQQSNYDSMSVNKDRRNRQLMNHFPDLSDIFGPQSERNSQCIDQFYEDHYIQGNGKPMSNEQYMPQDVNQIVNSFQSFMAGCEQDTVCRGDFPSMQIRMETGDSMAWNNTSPVTPTRTSATMQKQLVAEYESVQKERNRGVRKHTFKRDVLQDLPRFNPQNTEYFQQPKSLSASLNFSNRYQNKMTICRENTSLPINMNQCSKHHIQWGQIQNKIKPQMQKEKKRMAGFLGESFSTIPLTNNEMVQGEKRQGLSQNCYFVLPGSMQPQRFDGENSLVSAGNTQQFRPLMYPINDSRRHSGLAINSNFNSRSTPAYGGGVPGMDLGDVVTSANEPAGFSSCLSDMMSHGGENTYHGMTSVMSSSMVMRQGGPMIQLYICLDECFNQWKCLERERKRTEIIISKAFHGKQTAGVTNTSLPKIPPNPTKADHLIVYQMREQARVASLLDKMECLCNVPLHINIHMALIRHHMAICIAQARRKEQIANMSQRQQQQAYFTEDRDTMRLGVALKDLVGTTCKLRTALFCALQMTLPKPINRQEQHVAKETTRGERRPSLFEGYSFKL